MATIGGLRVDLFANIAEFREGLDKASGDLKRFSRRTERTARQFEAAGSRLTIGITAPFALFALKTKNAARDAAELQSAFDIAFGDMAGAANVWAEETGDAFGRSTQQLQQAAFDFQQLFRQAAPTEEAALSLSTAFAELATDAGSFFNVSDTDALQKLRAGLAGESEPLRRFGVFINEAAVAQRALALGLAEAGDKLTDQQKILARSSLIFEQLEPAVGDVVRTSQSLANQEKALKAELDELLVTVGNELVPVFIELTQAALDIVRAFKNLSPETQKTIVFVGALAAAIGPLLLAIGTFVRVAGVAAAGLAALATRFGVAGAAAKGMSNKIIAAAAAMPIANEAGKALGNQTFKLGQSNDAFLATTARIPKILGGMGLSADQAREAVRKLREEQERAANPTIAGVPASIARPGLTTPPPLIAAQEPLSETEQAVAALERELENANTRTQELLAGIGNISTEKTEIDDVTADLERLRGMVDPVTQAFKEYNTDLGFAKQAGLDMADAQRALAEQLVQSAGGIDAVRDSLGDLPPLVAEIVAQQDQLELDKKFERLREIIFPVNVALEEYEANLDLAAQAGFNLATSQDMLAEEFIAAAGGVEAIKAQIESLPEPIQRAAERLETVKEKTDQLKTNDDTFDGLSRGLERVITQGASFEDTMKSVILELLRAKAIAPFLDDLFSLGQGSTGGNILGAIGGGFGGFLAKGGFTAPGESYIVGENGPELFTPNMTGTVAPNQSVTNNVNMNIQTPDANSFRDSRRNIQRRQKRGLENV